MTANATAASRTPSATVDLEQPEQPPHLTATLLLACLAQFMVILDVSVVNVALPSIRAGLHFSEVDLQWVVNAYTVTFAGFLLLGGRAADLLGRRRVFVAGLVLFAITSLAGGVAQDQGLLIGARALQGLGAAVIAPASLAILTTTFTESAERNRAVGIWSAMGGAGGAAGVLLGGVLTEISWRWILFINIPIGLLVALATARLVLDSRAAAGERNFDLAGALAATVGLSLLVLGIVRTDQTGWGSAQALGLIAAGLLLLVGFVVTEGRFASQPLMPLRIWGTRMMRAANAIVLFIGAATFGMWFFVSLYMQQVLGYSPIKAGLAFLPMTVAIVISSTIASRTVQRVGPKRLLVLGMSLLTVGLALFTRIHVHGTFVSDLLLPGVLTSLGIGFAFVPATICAVFGVAPDEAGLASGLVNTSRMFGGALGLAVLTALATSHTNADLRTGATELSALTDGFRLALGVGAGMTLVGALVAAFALPRLTPHPVAQPHAVEPA